MIIPLSDLEVWLREHGFEMDDVFEAEIALDSRRTPVLVVFEYNRDETGSRYLDEVTGEAAYRRRAVQLQRFPLLEPGGSDHAFDS